MSFFDLVKTSFTNLYQRRARTLLTILGVIIGTMSIVLMIALGEGSAQVFMEQVSQSTDLTKIEIYVGYSSNPNDPNKIDDTSVATLEKLAHVQNVLPITDVPLYVKSARYAASIYISAAPLEKLQPFSEKLAWGSISKSNELNLYLGESILQDFRLKQGNKEVWELPQATDINFETERFDIYFGDAYYYTNDVNFGDEDITLPNPIKGRVAGAFAMSGSELDYQGFIDIDFVQKLLKSNKKFCEWMGITGNYQRVYVYADDMNNVQGVLEEIKALGYQAYSPMEYIKQMQEESRRQQAQWGAVGAIALLVSAIGIINTMLTSIMERKREIAVLKVLGCSLPNINAMFLIEAAVIGMLGGIIGVGLSYGISILVQVLPPSADGTSFLGNFFGGSVRFVITPYVAIAAVVGAALIGMIAGIYPSVRAMKMSPLAALRDE